MTEKLLERRRTRRISIALPVMLENATGVTRDVSSSGVFFWKRGVFAYGDSIRFSLARQADTGKILQRCKGVVVRTDPRGEYVGVAASITESTNESVPSPVGATPSWVAAPGPLPESGDRGSDLPPSVSETVDRSSLREAAAPEPLPESWGRGSYLPASVSETVDRPSSQGAAAPEPLPESGDRGSQLPRPLTEKVDRPSSQGAAAPEPPPDTQHRVIRLPASVVETVARWSSLLRSKALEACEELQDQEVIRWDIPHPAEAETIHRGGVTVCSIGVVDPASHSRRIPEHSGVLGESAHVFDSLSRHPAYGEVNAGASAPVGEGESEHWRNRGDGRSLWVQLEVDIEHASGDKRATDLTPLPKIFIRVAPARDDKGHHARDGSLLRSYSDPSEAFEAFLALAIERAILANLAVQGLENG